MFFQHYHLLFISIFEKPENSRFLSKTSANSSYINVLYEKCKSFKFLNYKKLPKNIQ
jgi:hypothetical protein